MSENDNEQVQVKEHLILKIIIKYLIVLVLLSVSFFYILIPFLQYLRFFSLYTYFYDGQVNQNALDWKFYISTIVVTSFIVLNTYILITSRFKNSLLNQLLKIT